jgi:hypothetical protein
LQITRYLSLNEPQFLGCLSAFIDTLSGELNGMMTYLRRLEGKRKGTAFAFEMQMDKHRYGSLIVLDRWAHFARSFAPHTELGAKQPMLDQAAERVQSAQEVIERSNRVLDDADFYSAAMVEACGLALATVELTFRDEKEAAEKVASLWPMLSEEYKQFRSVFLSDLSDR